MLATPTITRAAMRVESARLLTREPHRSDQRHVRLCLIDEGRRLRRTIDREMTKLNDRALVTLDQAESEQLVRNVTLIREYFVASQRE